MSKGFPEAHQHLIDLGGGYFRNTIRKLNVTCATCSRPVDGYQVCFRCNDHSGRADLADQVAAVTYAWPGDQSGSVMYRYKDPMPPPANWSAVQFLAAYALVVHTPCLERALGVEVTHWTVVPSLRRPPGSPHPLRAIVLPAVKGLEVPVQASATPTDPRGITPGNFIVPWRLDGAHVLIVDDTWTGGGHAQSMAAALKAAGATWVSTLVLARWLDPARDDLSKRFIQQRLVHDFEPDMCPVSGGLC